MAENESIGGISVEIVGDYSQLQADINSAAQIAAKGGQDIAKGLNSGAASVDVLATAAKIATSSIDGLTEKISALVGAGMSTAQAMAQVQSEALAVAAAAGSAGAAVGGLSEEERAAATAATSVSQAFAAMGAAVAAVAEEEKSAAAAAAAVSGAWSAAAAAGAGLSDEEKAIAAAAAAAAAAEKAAADAAAILAKSQQEATAALKAFTDGAGALMGIGASITAAVTVPILGIGGAALKVAGDFEQTKIAFTTMMGSAQAATAFLTQLRNFALTTPFEFPDLTRAAQKMTALGFSTQQVIPMLRTIGDAVAGLGQGSETINRLVKAFGDMQAKGKVSAQEMNQFAESGIAAWKAVADAIGVSIPKAMKMAEQGMISSATAIPAILDSMNQKFSGMMEKQSQTLLGQWSNIKDKIVTILTELGTALAPGAKILVGALNGVLEAAQSAVHVFSGLPAPIQAVVIAAAGLAAATGPAIAGLGALGFAIRGIQEALPAVQAGLKLAGVSADSFGSAMSGITSKLAPVALALAVVAGAVAAFHFGGAQKEVENFADAVQRNFSSIAGLVTTGLSGLAESASSMFRSAMDGIASVIPQPIKDAFEAVREAVKGIIQKISDEAKSIFGGMGSSISKAFSQISIWDIVAPQFANLRDGLHGATAAIQALGGEYKEMADAAVNNLRRVTQANLDMAHSAAVAAGGFTVSATSITAVSAAVKGLTDKQNEANSALKTAKAALDEVKKSADGSAESHQLVARATAAYDAALKAANVTTGAAKAITKEYSHELQEAASFGRSARDILDDIPKSFTAYSDSIVNGGRSAQAMLNTVNEKLRDAAQLTEGLRGAPLAAVQAWIDKLRESQATLQTWATADWLDKFNEKLLNLSNTAIDQEEKIRVNLTGAWEKYRTEATRIVEITPLLRSRLMSMGDAGAGIVALQDAMAKLGVKFKDVEDIAGNFNAFDVMARQTPSIDLVTAAWGKLSQSMQNTHTKDLPMVIAAYDAYIARLAQAGASEGQLIQKGEEKLQQIIRIKTETGASATAQIIALDTLKQKEQDLIDKTRMWGDLYVSVKDDILKAYGQIGGAVANAIVDGQNLGKALADLGKQALKAIIGDVVNTALKALRIAILGTTDDVAKLKKSFEDLAKSMQSAIGGVPSESGGAPLGATSGAGGAGASMSSTIGMAGAIASIGTLISSFIGNFQMAGMNKSLDLIVKHTLEIANEAMNRRKDAWDQHLALSGILNQVGTAITDSANAIITSLTSGLTALIQSSVDIAGTTAIITAVRDVSTTQITATTAVVNILQQGFNATVTAISESTNALGGTLISGFQALISSLGSVRKYSSGGMVPNTGLAMLHAGELVIPAADVPNLPDLPGVPQPGSPSSPSADTYRAAPAAGGGTQTNTFYIYQATDPRETTRQIAQTLKRITPSAAAYST